MSRLQVNRNFSTPWSCRLSWMRCRRWCGNTKVIGVRFIWSDRWWSMRRKERSRRGCWGGLRKCLFVT